MQSEHQKEIINLGKFNGKTNPSKSIFNKKNINYLIYLSNLNRQAAT